MKSIVIIGGGGHAKVLISVLKKNKIFDIIGYTDNIDRGFIMGVKYLGNDTILEKLIIENICNSAALGIGQVSLKNKRPAIINKMLDIGFEFPPIISKESVINEDVKIGNGTVVFDGVIINSGSKIGNYSIINTGVLIDHDSEIGDYTHIATGAVLSGGAKVQNNSMIGSGATIIQYKVVCKNCMIGAGSVVIKSIEEPGTYVGNPARKIK